MLGSKLIDVSKRCPSSGSAEWYAGLLFPQVISNKHQCYVNWLAFCICSIVVKTNYTKIPHLYDNNHGTNFETRKTPCFDYWYCLTNAKCSLIIRYHICTLASPKVLEPVYPEREYRNPRPLSTNRKISKPRHLGLDFSNRSEVWDAPRQ